MPQPTVSDVHVNRPLTDVSVAYVQESKDYICTQVAPIVPVDKQSDSYFVFDQNDFLRDEAKPRADGAESAGSGFKLSNDSYKCVVNAFHKDWGPQAQANADDDALDMEDAIAQFVTQKMLIRQEGQWASDFFKTGAWGLDLTGVAASPSTNQFVKWSNYAASDPLEDFEVALEAIKKKTGFKANTAVLGYTVARKLRRHPILKDQIKYTSARTLTPEMIAEVIGVERVIIASAVKATNKENATAAYDFAVGATSAWIGYVNPRPARMMPSAMYTFAWKAMPGGLGETIQIAREPVPLSGGAVRIEAQAGWHNKIVGADLGVYFDQAA